MKETRGTKFYYDSEKGYDVIDLVKHYDLNFNMGNVLKYIVRAGKKTELPIADLEKAAEYIKREIEHLKAIQNG